MKVAVFGCLHGQLNDMFKEVEMYEKRNQLALDLIIVCGDCQTIRHEDDLRCLHVKPKYRQLGDFHEYYSGVRKVPRLTIFVGGNHEASNYLMTLPYGGWVCDNFYYLGFAGVVKYRGLRIGGVSGIYKKEDYNRGRFERLPLDYGSMVSIYHTRRLDIFRLSLLSRNLNENNQLDVFMSHDWPARIYEHGEREKRMHFERSFSRDVRRPEGLGSPVTRPLMDRLKPSRWFAAHMHYMLRAKVNHDQTGQKVTDFLSLNKILKHRHYCEFMDILPSGAQDSKQEADDDNLYYDEEWLTILRKTIELEYKSSNNVPCPNPDDEKAQSYYPTSEEIAATREMMTNTGGFQIKRNFCMVEPVIYNRENGRPASIDRNREIYFPNPQHVDLCTRLDIIDKIADELASAPATTKTTTTTTSTPLPTTTATTSLSAYPRNLEARPTKKQAVELDEDGCLPFFIDKKGDN